MTGPDLLARDIYRRARAELLVAQPRDAEDMLELKMAPFASDPATTLRPSPLLVVSMKPYGAPARVYPFGWEQRADDPGFHRWYDGDRAGGNFVREADKLLRATLKAMQLDLAPRDVCNTYAYGFRAHDAQQLKTFGLERIDCSAFHRAVLEIVDPKVILCIGNGKAPSAFATYRDLLTPLAEEEDTPAPRIKVRSFTAEGRLVIGVPHLSYVRAEAVVETVVRRLRLVDGFAL